MKPANASARVLIVDDDAFIRSTIRRMLMVQGYGVPAEAGDGTIALAMLEAGLRPELIICDVQMSPMDGLTFVQYLRFLDDPAQANVPVIMLTAVASLATVRDSTGLGVSGYLLKPVSPKQLVQRTKAILG